MDEQNYKDALLKKKVEILGLSGIKPLQASMENNTARATWRIRRAAITKSISSSD